VQVQDPTTVMPIEDPTVRWSERDAPFQSRRIRIGKQTFDTPAQNEFCENSPFTPCTAMWITAARAQSDPQSGLRGNRRVSSHARTDSPATRAPPGLMRLDGQGCGCARQAGRNCGGLRARPNDVFDEDAMSHTGLEVFRWLLFLLAFLVGLSALLPTGLDPYAWSPKPTPGTTGTRR